MDKEPFDDNPQMKLLHLMWIDTKEIKHKVDKFNLIVMALIFLCGIIVGMNSSTWKPFIAEGYNFFTTVKNATSIAKGQ
ncbi:MAG: hypothetical protein U9O94_07075 [Nanoarchaeota archaeon]|nr:hypothetical protein [Nanoarchaeota archaeon]